MDRRLQPFLIRAVDFNCGGSRHAHQLTNLVDESWSEAGAKQNWNARKSSIVAVAASQSPKHCLRIRDQCSAVRLTAEQQRELETRWL
jgi:hypothetical protein